MELFNPLAEKKFIFE